MSAVHMHLLLCVCKHRGCFLFTHLDYCGHFSTYAHIMYRAANAAQYKTEVLYFKMYREDNNTRNAPCSTDDELLHRILEEKGVKRADMQRSVPTTAYPVASGQNARNRSNTRAEAQCPYGDGLAYGVTDRPLAIVYSPIQEWRMLYNRELGLSKGTIFEELDLPLTVKQSNEGGCYRG